MHKLIYIFIFSAGILNAQTKMTSAEADAIKSLVKEKSESTQTITSDFAQYKHLEFLSNDIESNGKMAFKAPDMVKWQYTKPFNYAIIFKNETLLINDDGNKSNMDVGGNKIFEKLNQLITASISGDMFDEAQFDISYFKKDGESLIHFLPRDTQFAEFIHAFYLTFNTIGEVVEIKMIEPSGDYTRIVLSNRITNKPLSDADFAQ